MANRPIHVVESGGDSTGLKEFADGADSGVQLPKGTTAQRDSSASTGEIRYNTDTKKVEYWNGLNWVSNSFVDVDEAEYDGVMTISSYTKSNYPDAYSESLRAINRETAGVLVLDNYANGKKWLNNFLMHGIATPRATHAGLTEADARLGAAGLNTLESEHSARHTPILELKTDMADNSETNATTKSNMGAITFTAKLGSYQYDSSTVNTHGWSNANKDFSLASITTRTRSNYAAYYDDYFSPPSELDIFVSHGYSGPMNVMNIGSQSFSSDMQVSFLLGRTGNYASTTRKRLAKFDFPLNTDSTISTSNAATKANSFTLATTEHFRTQVAPPMNFNGTSFGSRVQYGVESNKHHYYIYHHPTEILAHDGQANHNTNPFGSFNFIFAKKNMDQNNISVGFQYTFLYYGGSGHTYGIDTNGITCKAAVRGYDDLISTNQSSWSSLATQDKITFDSSFPSGGSTTTGSFNAAGFITFKITGTYQEGSDELSVRFSDWDVTNL